MWGRTIGFAVLTGFCCLVPARAQDPLPPYQHIFDDPPRYDQLTTADLPYLGRLAVLEATSMFVHARSELVNSPNSFRMLEDIRTLWNAADAFTYSVSEVPTNPLGLDAGRLGFIDLQAAFDQVRNTFAVLPGGAERSGRNLVNLTRIMAAIGPLLRQEQANLLAVRPRVVALGPVVLGQVRGLLAAIGALKSAIDAAHGQKETRKGLDEEMKRLSLLVDGLGRVAEGPASALDLAAAMRPVRIQAQRLDQELQRAGPGGVPQGNERRAVRRRIDRLADQLQLQREIVPERVSGALAPEALRDQLDRTAAQADRLLAAVREPEPALDQRLIASDVRRLRLRLFLLRQSLLGREPAAQVSQALRGVAGAQRQLVEAAGRVSGGARGIEPLTREVEATIRQVEEHLSKAR